MKILIIFLLLAGLGYAEEFQSDKQINSGELVKEIEIATGIDLEGIDQIGYLSTTSDKIEIKLKDRDLTQNEKDKIDKTIKSHSVEMIKKKKDTEEKLIKESFKLKLGLNEEEFKKLKLLLNDN